MKKLIAVLAVLVVITGAALWAVPSVLGFTENTAYFRLPGELTGLSLDADPEITVHVTVTDTERIAAMSALLEAAQRTALAASQDDRLIRLGLNASGEAFTYDVFNAGGALLLYDNANWYILDQDKFFAITIGIDGFYRYRQHPRAMLIIDDGQPEYLIPVVSSSYAHRRLDGSFLPSAPPVSADLSIADWEKNRLPQLKFSHQPGSGEVIISTFEEVELFRGTPEDAADFPLIPGSTYGVRIIARYESPNYTGTIHFRYTLHTSELKPSFEISGNVTDLGEALVLRAHNLPQGEHVQSRSSIEFRPVFFPDGHGGAVALFPVSIHTSPGEHFIELRAGGVYERFPITVLSTQFEVQRFTIDPSTAAQTMNSEQANAEYRRVIHPLRLVDGDSRHWEGRFANPVEGGRITTPFAVIRFVNGTGPMRHAQIDIALPEGTPVYAPAAGRVLFAGYLQLTGNTIAIEHGFGLRTWYYHLVSMDVQANDMVRQGQKIGEVGSTGFSTGPHLHYGMSVFNVFINPDTAANTNLFDW